MVALICEYFLYPVNDIPRLVHYFFQQSLEILSRSVFHVHLTFFRLINQAGIFHCSSVGVAQNFHPIWRRPRTGDHRTTEIPAGENYTRQLAPHIGSLVLIHQLKERRRIGQSRVPFWPTLKDMPVKTVLVPGIKRFATRSVAGYPCHGTRSRRAPLPHPPHYLLGSRSPSAAWPSNFLPSVWPRDSRCWRFPLLHIWGARWP